MKQADPYLTHLSENIEDLERKLSEAKASRDNYIRYVSSNASARAPANGLKPILTDNDEMPDRKGLRSEGRTRDLFEFFYKAIDGSSLHEAEKITGYSLKQIKQFIHRYKEQDLLLYSGDKIFLTTKGKTLVEKSQPYTGRNSSYASAATLKQHRR